MARQADGTLVRTRVLAFSTHGLVTGDFTGLTELALALDHPPEHADPGADGLLTASQASALKLYADRVILSACNRQPRGARRGGPLWPGARLLLRRRRLPAGLPLAGPRRRGHADRQ